jgi:riboflavin synthase
MFTGIIEKVGKVLEFNNNQSSCKLIVQIKRIDTLISVGDSVAINGTCLTVEKSDQPFYHFTLSPETLEVSSLSNLEKDSYVNIELPLTINKFINGHIVSGHVDSLGTVTSLEKVKDSWLLLVTVEKNILKYITTKGSISIDGVSLTVNDIKGQSISLMIIPHTYENTIIKYYKSREKVNIEVDYISKYLEKLKND